MPDSPTKVRAISRTQAWIILITVGIVVYSNSLQGPFIYDDDDQILKNTSIHNLWPPTWFTQAFAPTQGIHGRVVVSFTLALNYYLGGTQVIGYHIVNIAIHILAAIILFGLIHLILNSPRLSKIYGQVSDRIALIIALIWLVHPLQTECVNYILQRSASLMGLFYLLTLYSSIRSTTSQNRIQWALASTLFCALGMASKEVMVSAPLMVLLCDRTFYFDSFQNAFRQRWKHYTSLAGTWVILAVTIWHRPHGNTIGFETAITPWDYAKNQCVILVNYLKLSIWPHPLLLDYGIPHPDLSLIQVLPQASIILILLIGTLFALKHNPPLGFLGAWFFIILAPTSSFIPIVTEVGAERRMYLPLAAIVTMFVIFIYRVSQKPIPIFTTLRSHNWFSYGLITGIIILFASLSYLRNQDYQDSVTIWQTALNITPNNPRALNNLGYQLNQHNRPDEAIPYLQRAIEIKPNYVFAHYNLGQSFLETGHPKQALPHFQKAVDTDTKAHLLSDKLIKIHNNLGVAFLKEKDTPQAILHFQKTIALDPSHFLAHNNLGVAYLQTGQYEKAQELFQRTLKINPNYTGAQSNLLLAQELLQTQQ